MSIIISLFLIIVCCVVIWRASDGFEAASTYLGRNLSEGVRGATINAIGSSMPELFTTLWFLFVLADKDGFAGGIGTTAGSAIFNGMIIPAIVIFAVIWFGIARYVHVSKKVILRDGLSLIVAEFCLIWLLNGSELNWWHGLVLMALYGVYMLVMFTTMKKSTNKEEEEETDEAEDIDNEKTVIQAFISFDLEALLIRGSLNASNAWSLLLVAILIIGGACALLVHSCEQLGMALNIPIYFIAVIIASAATSVPDTIISYRDAIKGEYDDAVANALGSNVFDICFALGFPLFLYTIINGPISMSDETVGNVSELRILLLFLTIAAFLIYFIGNRMGRLKAFLLLGLYLLFTGYILGKAYELEISMTIGTFLRGLMDF